MPHGTGFRNRVRVCLVAGIVTVLAAALPAGGTEAVPYWGQVQSHLEALDSAPLIAANWHGRYRPYLYLHDRFVPLITAEPPDVADVDLVSPLPVSRDRVLMLGSASGRPEYDLFLYDRARGALANLTATPAFDEGRPCFEPTSERLAYRTGTGERIARLDATLVPLPSEPLPPFESCTWLDSATLLGIERAGTKYRLHQCRVGDDRVACEPRPALVDVDAVVGFTRARAPLAILGRRRNDSFRRPWAVASPFETLTPVAMPDAMPGDVLDVDDEASRVGFHGRYRSSLAPGSSATVYVTRRIGTTMWGVVATDRMTRTLARLEHAAWQPLRETSVTMPAHVAEPVEVWMRSPAGEVYQAFYFGERAPAPRRVVVWWHGGPAESISPRFNPYFQRLNELGFGVLAVNYPGSTGRGGGFEARFRADALGDCVRTTWDYLAENGVETVVSWSVSSGITVQTAVLAQQVPVSALVDQSAWGGSDVRATATARGVPTFTIRGRHDPYGPAAVVDFWYPGGHDLTMADDFTALFAAVGPFLASAPRVTWPAPANIGTVLEVTAPEAEGWLAFELATHVQRACFHAGDVATIPTGVPPLARLVQVRTCVARRGADDPKTRVVRIDLGSLVGTDRLAPPTIASDGTLVHRELQAAAERQCVTLRASGEAVP